MKKLLLTFIVVFVALLIIGLGGFWYYRNKVLPLAQNDISLNQNTVSSTQDEIANWKTFVSTKYSFLFKYPSDWTAKELEDGSVFLTSSHTQQIIKATAGERTDEISLLPHKDMGYLEGWLPKPISFSDEYFSSEKVKTSPNRYIGRLILGGRTAFQILHDESAPYKFTIMQNPDGSIFGIYEIIPNPDQTTKIEPYDSILSSLTFGH